MKRKAASPRTESVSPPRPNQVGRRDESPKRSGSESPSPSSSSSAWSSSSSSDVSREGSCVSSEAEETSSCRREAAPPMLLVGCPRCLMYVMLTETNPKCPRCQSTVLLDFLNDRNFSDKTHP